MINEEEKIHEIIKIIKSKAANYGSIDDKISTILKEIYPKGISQENYKDALVITRLLEKICRTSNINNDNIDSKIDAYNDIIGYAMLAIKNNKE